MCNHITSSVFHPYLLVSCFFPLYYIPIIVVNGIFLLYHSYSMPIIFLLYHSIFLLHPYHQSMIMISVHSYFIITPNREHSRTIRTTIISINIGFTVSLLVYSSYISSITSIMIFTPY